MHSCGSSDHIFVWLGLGEVNRGNGSIFFDKYGAFERPPIAGLYAMFFWSRFWMFTKDERLEIHSLSLIKRATNHFSVCVTCD